MKAPVVDCSIAIAWVMADEESIGPEPVLDVVKEAGGVAPAVWWAEVRNVLIVAERRGRMTSGGTEVALAALDALGMQLDHAPDSEAVLRLARTHSLAVYDSMYLDLALREDRALATLDRRLVGAALAAGVTVMPQHG